MNVLDLTNPGFRDLPDAWFQTLFRILENGSVFTIDEGSYAGQKRLEFDYITLKINYPNVRPLLPQIEAHYGIPNPVDEDHLMGSGNYERSYLEYLMGPEVAAGESYTYGQRLTKYKIPVDKIIAYKANFKDIIKIDHEIWRDPRIIIKEGKDFYVNQINLLIWTYKNRGHRNNQMILQVGEPSDMLLLDPPCLRSIDTRIQNNKLIFYVYFRSWDLWGGFPENLAAIQMMKEYIATEIGVDDGPIIAASKGLHIYDYTFDIAKCLRMKDDMQLQGE